MLLIVDITKSQVTKTRHKGLQESSKGLRREINQALRLLANLISERHGGDSSGKDGIATG